ncbi:MAG: hypothetical protein GX638_04835 [Crenarchaeota archaeon]|nr:hypothetical protein [Thermoproteota archaeon]
MAKSMGSKTLVPVSDTIIADVTKASTKQDSTNSKFIEEALKHAVQMNSLGITSKELENICEVMHDFRVLGASFLPMDITKYLMAKEYSQDKEGLKTKWYESGLWYGTFFKEKFADPIEGFRNFLLVTRWDLNEVEATQNRDTVKLRCISNILSLQDTELLVKFIDGVMHGLGYRVEKIDYVKGIAAVEYKK